MVRSIHERWRNYVTMLWLWKDDDVKIDSTDDGENFEINEDMGDDYDSDSEFLKSFGQT